MMARTSAGILMWRRRNRGLEVLLGHFGGPMWKNRDAGAWAIPKGEPEPGEDHAACARREFEEETGVRPEGALVPLGRIVQKGGKQVEAFALEGDLDTTRIVSNQFTMEWPPRSGRFETFAEIDRAEWMALDRARERILPSQAALLDRLEAALGGMPPR